MRHAILLAMREAQPNRREFLATIAGGAVMAGLPKAAHAQEAPPETPMSPNPNGYDFSFDNYDNHEKTSDIPLVATYVDGMKSVLVQINSANSDEAAREKIRITVNALTMGYLQIHAEQNNIKEPNPAVDAEAMALALIEAMSREPKDIFLIEALKNMRKEISTIAINRSRDFLYESCFARAELSGKRYNSCRTHRRL